MNNFMRYFKMDQYRLFSNRYTLLFPVAMALSIFLCSYFNEWLSVNPFDLGVIEMAQQTLSDNLFFITLVLPMALYCNTLREDFDKKADGQFVLRGNYLPYLLSKIITNALAPLIGTEAGGLLFCFLWACKWGWFSSSEAMDTYIQLALPFSALISQRHYVWYSVLVFGSIGLFASFMAQIGMFVSFFFKDKTTNLIFPVFFLLIIECIQGISDPTAKNIFHVFNPALNCDNAGYLPILPPIALVILISLFSFAGLSILYRRRRLC